MHYINLVFFSLFILIFLTTYINKYSFFLEAPSIEKRKIHSKPTLQFGGVILLLLLISYPEISDTQLLDIIFFSSMILVVGLFSDLKLINSYSIRFYTIIIIITFFVIKHEFLILNYDHDILNLVFKSHLFVSYIFSILGLIFLVNGINFIDGNNGLSSGVCIIILLTFLFQIWGRADYEIILLLTSALIILLFLFYFNFVLGKLFMGDCGAYFCGFFIGSMSIFLANQNLIYSTSIACTIFYPFMELFFSFWRRIFFNKTNPFKPDFLHLHSLLYQYLNSQNKIKVFAEKLLLDINSFTSALILVALVLINIILFYLNGLLGYLNSFILLISLYLFIYFLLYKIVMKIKDRENKDSL